MGFKLVRVDATEPCKIPLAIGTQIIGRGKFLDCHDHRVSRNHGQLEVTDDTVRIKALHQNPFFFRRKCTENTRILPQNEYIELSNGDQFGLVPDGYWYELIYCIENLVPPAGVKYTPIPVKVEKAGDIQSASGSSRNESKHITEKAHPSGSQEESQPTLMETEETQIETTSPIKRSHTEDPDSVTKKAKTEEQTPPYLNKTNDSDKTPDLSEDNETMQDISHNNENTNDNTNKQTNIHESNTQKIINTLETLHDNTNIAMEDLPSESVRSTDDIAKVKMEPDTEGEIGNAKTASENVKMKPNIDKVKTEMGEDVKPGPSNDQQGGCSDNPAGNALAAQSNVNAAPREKCMYGADCYRKNPVHKARFSHPGDGDWARATSRRGAACREPGAARDHRRGRHRPREHGTRKGIGGAPRHRDERKNEDSSDSEGLRDSGCDEPVLTRTRQKRIKTVIKDISESEEDPFASDDTDDWMPSD